MKKFTLILAFVCLSNIVPAIAFDDSSGTMGGKVAERESGKPLSHANIFLKGTLIGTSAGENGEFVLTQVAPGVYDVQASLIGYAPQTKQVEIKAGQTVIVEFSLTPSSIVGQPITVTATRGRERETPATFSTLSRADIKERYTTQDIPVLLSDLPSTTYYSDAGNGIGYTYLNIRGFDARRIAVMVNGIPQNDPEDHNVYWLDFPDIGNSSEDIQVQRGAGSAFYGPPAIGGSVNLVTSDFGRERSITLSSGIGSFNTRKYVAAYNSGLIDSKYAFHGRLSRILSSGYRDKSWVDFNGFFLGIIRYDENMTTQLNFYGGPVSDHLAYYGIPKADVTDREKRRANPILRDEEIENFSQPHYELFNEWKASSTLTINNTFFMVFGEGFFDYDGTWAPYSYYRLTPENGFNVTGDPENLYFGSALIRAFVSNKQYGWLPRATFTHANGEFIAGAELRFHRSLHWGRLQRVDMSPVALPEDYHYYDYKGAKDIISLYAHEMYSLRPDLKLMLELQYAYSRYRLYDEKYAGTDFSVPYYFLNPRIGLNYNITDAWNAYFSIAHTSREPQLKSLYDAAEASTPASWGAVLPQFAVNANGNYNFDSPLVKPEKLFDVEIGAGYNAAATSASANLYWMEFSNEIVKSGQVDRFGQPITGNAARTRHLGVELTGMFKPIEALELRGNATFSSNRLIHHTSYAVDYDTAGNAFIIATRLDKNPIAGFPDILANVRVTYRMNNLALSLSGRYVGEQYTDNFKNEANTVDPYFTSDAFIMYKFANLIDDVSVEAKLQINNIFDRLYAAYGEGSDFFVGAERNMFFNLSINL